MFNILAVDDDVIFLTSIKNLLEYKRYRVSTCANPLDVENLLRKGSFHCVLLDVKMPGMDGIEVLERVQKIQPNIPVIMVSGQSTISIAVETLKKGAYDFIEKPVDGERLLVTLKNALDKQTLSAEKDELLSQIRQENSIIGQSPALVKILKKVQKLAPVNTKVLITGETGTGKELIARALHNLSTRAGKPYFKLNCAAIPETLLESELFGHVRGAFTGALNDKKGQFEAANEGTLFLDEIGDLHIRLQAKLLQVLQDGSFTRIGSTQRIQTNARIIAATNQNLEQMIEKGRFRADLFHRLNVTQLELPPLRERREDIPLLAQFFVKKYAGVHNKAVFNISDQAILELSRHDWPGNIRELKNVLEKAVIFSSSHTIDLAEIRSAMNMQTGPSKKESMPFSLREKILQYERELILNALNMNDWKRGKTAQMLGIDRSALFKKMRKLNISA